MPKPIAVMYVPNDNYFGNNFTCGEMMRTLNGDDPKVSMKHEYSDYLWFVFVKPSVEAPELEVFHEKDFTEVQYEELKKLVTDHLQAINDDPTRAGQPLSE